MLAGLAERLARSVADLTAAAGELGRPELVATAAAQSAKLFQTYGKSLPSGEQAHAAAIEFMQSHELSEREIDLIASVLSDPVREYAGARPLGHKAFAGLLDSLWLSAEANELPRLTWYGLLSSYFEFSPANAPEVDSIGWGQLRSFLQTTWPIMDKDSGTGVVPDWVTVLREDPKLLRDDAAYSYALDILRGNEEVVRRLSADLAIPESSWFWHSLVLGSVRRAGELPDDRFKPLIPRLISLIHGRPVFRDDALIALLTRYHACRERGPNQELCDYVVNKDVWRNPKLKAAGIATTWNRVSDEVWRMVLGWVNERNLRDFFGILASRNNADEGRLAFWSKYLNQISWTRLVFGAETLGLIHSTRAIRDLIAREEGAYAVLQRGRDLDAFVMQLGEYIIVEFSKTPNAAYVYQSSALKFDRYAKRYAGSTDDLKYGFNGGAAARFVHNGAWASEASSTLKRLGIYPDSSGQSQTARASQTIAPPSPRTAPSPSSSLPKSSRWEPPTQKVSGPPSAPIGVEQPHAGASATTPARPVLGEAPSGATFKMKVLAELVRQFEGAYIDDRRRLGGGGGRLWVENPKQHVKLERMLVHWGFKWAQARQAFYFPES